MRQCARGGRPVKASVAGYVRTLGWDMAARAWHPERQRHFVIRCWVETPPGSDPFWRGRVQEVGADGVAFEDVRGLLDFILDRLRRTEGIELPPVRNKAGDA